MVFPRDIEVKIGFDKVRSRLRSLCSSALGMALTERARLVTDYDLLQKWLAQTGEFMKIPAQAAPALAAEFADVTGSLEKSTIEGAFLTEAELLAIAGYVDTYGGCTAFFSENRMEYSHLFRLGEGLRELSAVASTIAAKIDKEGLVKETASPQLADIRGKLKTKYNRVRKSLQRIYRQCVADGLVPQGASIAVREGRMVIPVLAAHKRRVSGFVHDESASGNTVFLEPAEVLEGNNELRELEYAEKREVIRILTGITDMVRAHLPDLEAGQRYLARLDFIRAKARYSGQTEAIIPKMLQQPAFRWQGARHPLLHEALQKEKKQIVPLNIALGGAERILVISGPNAGGKSVTLKTVALLQYMLQCGLPIPVGESSQAGIFDHIFIDIGDEQSLENDLSTYSSHLRSMKCFLDKADERSLCLIDEFGTGTDPQFGGAIAEAVLNELTLSKACGVITTHYGNLKSFAENTEGIANGAMRFDVNRLEPLFELETGKPGSSFSLEIARKTGLPPRVTDYAKAVIGDKSIDVDHLLSRLEQQQQAIRSRDIALKDRENRVKQLEEKYRRLNEELESNKKAIIGQAKTEAAQLLKSANKEIENTIRHIKSNSAQKAETKKARQRLREMEGRVVVPQEVKAVSPEGGTAPIKVGDTVKIIDQEVTGTVVSEKGGDLEVEIGLLKTKIKRNRLEKISKKQDKRLKKQSHSPVKGLDLTSKLSEFNTTLNIRGKRVEEVLPLLERFLDEALLFGLGEVRVLHGKGGGVLRAVVRDYAGTQAFVATIRDEHIDKGGAGISVISLQG